MALNAADYLNLNEDLMTMRILFIVNYTARNGADVMAPCWPSGSHDHEQSYLRP